MLIAISGSQGTGKSTTMSYLPYAQIERKTSRSILSDWNVTLSEVNNDRELTVRFQDEILTRKLEDEALAVTSPDIFCTERTYMDLFAYAVVAIGKDNEYSSWLDSYFERCLAAQSSYSKVFYLTGGHFSPVYDGVRAVNAHYSTLVDLFLQHYTLKYTPNGVTVISTPDQSQRVDTIIEQVDTIK